MTDLDNLTAIDVCVDCYFAHHYGATRIEREATERERDMWLHPRHYERELMGLEFSDDGLTVAEWFSGDSDQRCECGEPLSLVPEDWDVTDFTCSDHHVEDLYDDDGDATGETTACDSCGQTGYEDGTTEFTWRSCDGCGCHLGGSRHRLALWPPKEQP